VNDLATPGAIDPSPIMQLSTAYWGAQTLFTANRLGIFAAIANGSRTVAEIAAASKTHERPLQLLLKACTALDLLRESAGLYSVSPMSDAFLVPGSENYLGDAIRYSDDLYDTWGKLEHALIDDQPQLSTEEYTGDDVARTRHFVRGMHNRALGIGSTMVNLVDLSGRRQMLDIGGGPGTYSALFTRKYPSLRSTVLDLPGVVSIASEIIADMGMSDQVEVLPGDLNTTEFPEGNDVVLISGVFHRESERGCQTLIRRAFDCLQSGGLLVLGDVFTDSGGSSPPFAALFGLNMLLTAPDGGVHADEDVAGWMEDVGFISTEIRPFPSPMPHRMILGLKPDR
jgi:cyclopropane fatty-acyl-phospholipid synthase-like methyltransferase